MAKHKDKQKGHDTETGPLSKMKRKPYEREMRVLHGELVAMQEWVKATGAKICIVFEGRDTAGKGGTIKAITERVSPRVFRVVALPAPTERERTQMFFQRYVPHLPAVSRPSKTMTIFAPLDLTHSCMATSSPCRRRSSGSYSLRFIGRRGCMGAVAVFVPPFPFLLARFLLAPFLDASPLLTMRPPSRYPSRRS